MRNDVHPEEKIAFPPFSADCGEQFPEGDLEALLDLCRHSPEEIREVAFASLIDGADGGEAGHFRRLIYFLMGRTGGAAKLPDQVREFLLEWIAFMGEVPCNAGLRESVERFLERFPAPFVDRLFKSRFQVRPFLRRLKAGPAPSGAGGASFRRRWRILRKRVLGVETSPTWYSLTLADLAPLRAQRSERGRQCLRKGRWLALGRPLLLPIGEISAGPSRHLSLSSVRWGSSGNLTARFWEELHRRQSRELFAVRETARQVSEMTGQVVLSWHNAALAAAGGWAFEPIRGEFPSDLLYGEFLAGVERRLKSGEGDPSASMEALRDLLQRREERLVKPVMIQALREARIRGLFDESAARQWEERRRTVEVFLSPLSSVRALEGEKYGWSGPASPHQQTAIEEILISAEISRSYWTNGLRRLSAAVREGQKLLDAGSLSCFVLPWIDKFFISSKRERDWEYLPLLVKWLEGRGVRPLILFWDDTSHVGAPSLQPALTRMRQAGFGCRGLGVFDSMGGTSRENALDTVLREHREVTLFALRPYSDVHSGESFHRMLECFAIGPERSYDSSWKDDLSFLYAGTQVFPLLSVRSEMEAHPAWVAAEGFRYPFGAYFRERVRREALGSFHERPDAFSLQYAAWANLG